MPAALRLAQQPLASSAGAWSGDRRDFLVVNGFARHTPALHGAMLWLADSGVVLLAALLALGWWLARRSGSARRLSATLWAAAGALLAVAVNQPVVQAVDEPRPFTALHRILVLLPHTADPGFPSDHATLAGAVAMGLVLASWRLGLAAGLVAALIAFARVYVGVHYPQDVVAGLALGAAVVAVGWLLVGALLTRVIERLSSTRLRPLLTARA